MDRAAIDSMIDDITKTLSEMEDKKSKEYMELSASLRNLQDSLIKDLTYEQNRIAKNMEQELKEQELKSNQEFKMKELEMESELKRLEIESRTKQEKTRSRWGFLGVMGAAVLGFAGIIYEGFSKGKRIEQLREIKEDQGLVDRDLVNLTR